MGMALVAFLAWVVGFVMGLGIGAVMVDGYISRKACRECKRRLVEFGFYSDGIEYKAVSVNADEVKGK